MMYRNISERPASMNEDVEDNVPAGRQLEEIYCPPSVVGVVGFKVLFRKH